MPLSVARDKLYRTYALPAISTPERIGHYESHLRNRTAAAATSFMQSPWRDAMSLTLYAVQYLTKSYVLLQHTSCLLHANIARCSV
jgi:hypothetical protein